MSKFLCNQSYLYIVQYIIFNLISIFIFGPNLILQLFSNKLIHALLMFLLPLILLQVLCNFNLNKTAWGIIILAIIFNVLTVIFILADPNMKKKVEEGMKKTA